MQHAQERMLNRIDHDSGMSGPHRHIAWLRTRYAPKLRNPGIKCRRRSIFIGESRFPIETVNKVRTIVLGTQRMARIHGHTRNLHPLSASQEPDVRSLLVSIARSEER